MTYSLEAAVVFADGPAATETLAALGQQGQFSTAEVRDNQQNILASWHYTSKAPGETFSNFISHWLFPAPVIQPIRHNGKIIGEVQLTARDNSISHFIWLSLAVLTGCILLASGIAITLTRHLHNGLVEALKTSLTSFMMCAPTAIFPAVFRKNESQNFTALLSTSIACWMKWKSGSSVCRQKCPASTYRAT